MKKIKLLAVGALALCLMQVAHPQVAQAYAESRPIPGRYIVVFTDAVARPDIEAANLVRRGGGELHFTYSNAVRGFAATLPAAAVAALARNPNVAWVEQDQTISLAATQSNATWGLDRIDQRSLPLNGSYVYNYTGLGVYAFVIDTGIRASHNEFGGRVSSSLGYTAINDGRGTEDCNGHGTHVAGTVGGSTYGVAKQVSLVPVRVLNCRGSGTTSGVIAGVDHVAGTNVRPAVANMSLGGGASSTLDTAVRNAVSKGVTMVVSAGNDSGDACTKSPAREPTAITVGATTNSDARASYSNFGSCLDLFAPGSSITSAWYSSNTSTNTISGTSMAAPHVAGVAALALQVNASLSPAQVTQLVVDQATSGVVTSAGSNSPNKLLYALVDSSGGGGGSTNQAPTASFTFDCTDLTCYFDGLGSSDPDGGISSYAWNFGDTTTGSGATISKTYASGGTRTVTLTVTDIGGATGSTSKSVSVTAPSSGGGGATLSGSSVNNGGTWTAVATLQGAIGSKTAGTWDYGSLGTVGCEVTSGSSCTFSLAGIPKNRGSVSYTDSSGSPSVTISKP